MSDEHAQYMLERVRLESDKLRQRAQSDEMQRNTALFIANMRERSAERLQDRKEALTQEGWRRDDERRRLDDELKRLEMASQVLAERVRGENARELATHNANLEVQGKIYDIFIDDIKSGRELSTTIITKFSDFLQTAALKLIEAKIQMKIMDRQHRNDMAKMEREHDNALEVDRLRLENDLLRAEKAHEQAMGRENAQRQQETFLAVIQSRLRNEEVSHAEIIRLIVRMIEGARAGGNAKDAEKWAADCFDEWERERQKERT